MARKTTYSRARRAVAIWLATLISIAITYIVAIFTASQAMELSATWLSLGPDALIIAVHLAAFALSTCALAWLSGVLSLISLCVLARCARGGWQRGEQLLHRISPRLARYTLTTVVGVSLSAATLAPAHAATEVDPFEGNLSWGGHVTTAPPTSTSPSTSNPALPTEAKTDTSEPATAIQMTPSSGRTTTASASGPSDTQSSPAETYTVRPGDSLWLIAAAHLPDTATVAQIDARCRELYALNESVIGADPNLILPGMQLQLPN